MTSPKTIVRLWGENSGRLYRWSRQWLSPEDADLVTRATVSELWLHASGGHVPPRGPFYHQYWLVSQMVPRRPSARGQGLSLSAKRTIQLPPLDWYNGFVALYCMMYSGSLLSGLVYDQRLAVTKLLELPVPGRQDQELVHLLAALQPEGFHALKRVARNNRYCDQAAPDERRAIDHFRRSCASTSTTWYGHQWGRVVPLLPEREPHEWGTHNTRPAPFPLVPKASQTSSLDLA